jgi:hypothetical protein
MSPSSQEEIIRAQEPPSPRSARPPAPSAATPPREVPTKEAIDSLNTLEEMLEMQESIDGLRLIVAQQGSQLRSQEDLIEQLFSKIQALEERMDDSYS